MRITCGRQHHAPRGGPASGGGTAAAGGALTGGPGAGTGGGTPTVEVTVPAGQAELAADALWTAGAVAVEERTTAGDTVVLVAAPPAGRDVEALLASVAGRWPAEVVRVDLDAALEGWRPHARAVQVGRLVVRPPWVPALDRGEAVVEIVVDPGRAFGSGVHESTRLALTALADLVHGGERVLDLGCGSGVLAIAALALGASAAVAVDVDPQAPPAARQNAGRNGVAEALVVHEADIAAAAGFVEAGSCDLVVANLLLPVLVVAAPVAARTVAPGGAVVAAGVLVEQVDPVVAAFAGQGLVAERPLREADGWAAVTFRPAAVAPPHP